jgi:hypothetical protein
MSCKIVFSVYLVVPLCLLLRARSMVNNINNRVLPAEAKQQDVQLHFHWNFNNYI